MDETDAPTATKRALWANVLALMERAYGGENLTRLARDSGIGPGSTTRIKEQRTSVGIDVLEKIAGAFGVRPWQLLTPDLGADLYELDAGRRLVPVFDPAPQQRPAPAPTTAGGLPVSFVERRHTPAPPMTVERRRGVTVYVHPQAHDPDAFPPRRPKPGTSSKPGKPGKPSSNR